MEYLLKSVLISSVVYLFYKMFLQKETFFQSIRWYFLIGIAISFILPIIMIPVYVDVAPVAPVVFDFLNKADLTEEIIKNNPKETMAVALSFNWLQLFKLIYFFGVIVFSLKFIIELMSLIFMLKSSRKDKNMHYKLVETAQELSPFSFFSFIIINKKQFQIEEFNTILEHEKVHVDQKHSIDNIIVQLFLIVQWFNPFAWLYKKELIQNLEYIADKEAQKTAITPKKYQYLLLKSSVQNKSFALSNNFFNSQLKNRIMMLQKSQTKKLNQVKYVLLIPLIALFLYGFNTKEIYQIKGNQNNSNPINPKFILPVNEANITAISGYGNRIHPITKEKSFHKGMDFIAYKDMDVLAVAEGVVLNIGNDKVKGNFVEIQHKNHYVTKYGHLGMVEVAKYEQVVTGDVIGTVGITGVSENKPHVHFEILKDGKNVNPNNYLIGLNSTKEKPNLTKEIIDGETYLITNNPKIANLKTVMLNSKTSQNEIKRFNTYYKEKTPKIRIVNVKRNKNKEIIGYDIQTKFEKEKRYLTNMTIKGATITNEGKTVIGNSKISKKDDNTFLFSYLDKKEEKVFLIAKGGGIQISGDSKIQSKGDKVEKKFSGFKENVKDTLKEKEIDSIGYITLKEKTYFYNMKNKKMTFFNKYGEVVELKLAKEVLKQFNKDHQSNYQLKEDKNKNFIHYNNQDYFYLKKKETYVFYDKYGHKVNDEISEKLKEKLNQNK